jgi:hypothetical protein
MAYEIPGMVVPMISSGNLSGQQYHFVKLGTAAGTVALATANSDKVFGVLQNTPSTGGGDAASVMISGISKVAKDSTSVAVEIDDIAACTTEGGVEQSTGGDAVWRCGLIMEAMDAGTTGLVSVSLNFGANPSTALT